ncbi:hypothetical protein ACFQV4_04860 [Streptomyces thermocarboxydus]
MSRPATAPTSSWSTSPDRTPSPCTTSPRPWCTAPAPPTSARPSWTAGSSCATGACSPSTSPRQYAS